MLAVAGGEGLTAARRLPGFPGDPCLAEMRSKRKLEKEKGTGVWALDELPWQWPGLWGGKEQSRPQSCHLLCHVSSQEQGKRAKPSWKCSHVAGHSPRRAWSLVRQSEQLCVCPFVHVPTGGIKGTYRPELR